MSVPAVPRIRCMITWFCSSAGGVQVEEIAWLVGHQQITRPRWAC
jgi:hypothetical protein